MKVVQLTNFGIDNYVVHTIPDKNQELGPYDVRIRMKAASLNYRDLLVAKGFYTKNVPFPLIPLSDGAGDVVEVGSLVSLVKVGDRVMPGFMPQWTSGQVTPKATKSALGGLVDGVLTEYFVENERGLVHIPKHLSYIEAATLPCAAVTAWNALFESNHTKAGDTILILGSGGVSTFALQFAKASGISVIATSGSDTKASRLKDLGADLVINYNKDPNWGTSVKEVTNGKGVDHVIEVGGAGTLQQSLRAVRMGGTVSMIGVLTRGDFDVTELLMNSIRLQGIFVGSSEMFRHMNRAIEVNHITPLVDKVFAMDDIAEALNYLESGKHFGKIVIEI